LSEFERGYLTVMSKKQGVIRKFSNQQLENLLKTSTKTVAQEIVVCLISNAKEGGILVNIDQTFNLSLKAKQEETKVKSSDTENSMTYAETEDEDKSFVRQPRLIVKRSS
jgi:small nuclear ribonucleoprotein (snRNP)-like protein